MTWTALADPSLDERAVRCIEHNVVFFAAFPRDWTTGHLAGRRHEAPGSTQWRAIIQQVSSGETMIRPLDARHGLSPEAVDGLRQARPVALALKNRHTAVLGYWVGAPSLAGHGPDELRAVLLPVQIHTPIEQDPSASCPVVIALERGTADWQRAAASLEPGDVVTVDWDWKAGAERVGWMVDQAHAGDIDRWRPVHFSPRWEVKLRKASSTLMTLLLNEHLSRKG